MLKNKKAQIGTTITWFPAFIIIFSIMVLFVGASISIAGQKKLASIASSEEEGVIWSKVSDNSKLKLEQELDFVLDSSVNGKTIKQEIIEDALKSNFIDRVLEVFGSSDLQKHIYSVLEKSEIKNRNLLFNYYNAQGTLTNTFKLNNQEETPNSIKISKTIFLGENKIVIGYISEGE